MCLLEAYKLLQKINYNSSFGNPDAHLSEAHMLELTIPEFLWN